jgi:MFS transporter, SP family, solute carrier family 2 (facilitated glucose transporter), member 1
MNTPGYVMSCRTNKKATFDLPSWIPGCIPMNEGKYGFVTSIYSIGGLFGSLYAPRLADGEGRRGAALINCSGFVLGPIIMALSMNVWVLALGRVISGLSSGVVGPVKRFTLILGYGTRTNLSE